ncbi:MAG: UvrD-helicase domain-containing protein [Terriglobales bacterium]
MAVAKPIPAIRTFEPDERQGEAIEHVHGPMLVIAGAGTGKTTVLTRRIARLIRDGHARPNEILAVTYTKNAVREMRERVRDELRSTNVSGLQIATFHEYCNELLGRYGKQFGVLDDQDLWIYLRKRIPDLHLNHFVRAANVSQFLHDLLGFMRRCQDDLVGPEKYAAYVHQLERGEVSIPRVSKSKDAEDLSDEEVIGRCQEIASVFATVERMLREDNLGTFGHMITHAQALLAENPELLAAERRRTRFILADEFQDVNFAQVKILKQLAGEERNVFAVGDPDQAIYRFRGASSAAFGLFQEQFPDAKRVVLGKNRRSTTTILKSAFALISRNPDVFPPGRGQSSSYQRSPLISAREEEASSEGKLPGPPVDAVVLAAKEIECADIVATIRDRQHKLRCKWSDFAVLYRQHFHREQIVAELVEQGVPFAIENMDVMDTPEARDLFACLGAVVSVNDSASLFRVASFPQFAIDPEKLRAGMKAIPREERKSGVVSVLAKIENGPDVLNALQQVRDEVTRADASSSVVLSIIIRQFALSRTSPAIAAVLEFVKRWEEKPKAITRTGDIAEFIDYLQYFRTAGGVIPISTGAQNAVRLMTAHVAKGLEFNHVFIIRANSNSFPSAYKEPLVDFPRELQGAGSTSFFDDKELNRQEERRLFYVAMTRARDSLTIYAKQGTGKKDPTPNGFLRDLLKDAQLKPFLRQRHALEFQTDLFAEAAPAIPGSPVSEWLKLPPALDLGARLSASVLQTYEICPLQFKLEREWRIPGEVPAAMEYGATIHRILLAYYASVRLERTIADDQLIELFKTDLQAAGIEEKYQQDLYERQGIVQLREFLANCKRIPVPKVLHTEEWFEMQIGQTKIVGRIDRIDQSSNGGVVITDYKTGRPKSQEDADRSLQLSIYALAAREKWGYRADQIVFHNLEDNSAVATRRTESQLQECRHEVEEVARKIAAEEFSAKPGFYCGFCAYRSLCPATEKRLYAISNDNNSSTRNSGAKT